MNSVSVFMIPLGAFAVAIVAIIAGSITQAHNRRVKADERMAMIARGIPLNEIEAFLNRGRGPEEPYVDSPLSNPMEPSLRTPMGRLANSRRAALVLLSVGIGVILLGAALTFILQERDVLSVCAAGLVPLAIGFGFLVDYNMQQKEFARFGDRIGGPLPPR